MQFILCVCIASIVMSFYFQFCCVNKCRLYIFGRWRNRFFLSTRKPVATTFVYNILCFNKKKNKINTKWKQVTGQRMESKKNICYYNNRSRRYNVRPFHRLSTTGHLENVHTIKYQKFMQLCSVIYLGYCNKIGHMLFKHLQRLIILHFAIRTNGINLSY